MNKFDANLSYMLLKSKGMVSETEVRAIVTPGDTEHCLERTPKKLLVKLSHLNLKKLCKFYL